jgi:hypothetical protein
MNTQKIIKRAIDSATAYAVTNLRANPLIERSLVLQGAIASAQFGSLGQVDSLADVEFSVFSQWGEDGIIDWLIRHNGAMPETFIEFGVEDFREANCRFLLMHRNWRGLVIDGSDANMARTRGDNVSWRHDLTAKAEFITRDNINGLISASGITGEIGILSVDIDGNDYWVWQAIDCISPHFVIAEYNSTFGDLHALTVPYKDDFIRSHADRSNLYYGASIRALTHLAAVRGYTLVGSNRAGSNAFFIRNDRMSQFATRIKSTAPRPSRFREGRDDAGRLSFLRGANRSTAIAGRPVVDVLSGHEAQLCKFGALYSDAWIAAMEGHVNVR